MANAGIKSTQAGTSLRTIMNNLTGEVKISGKSIGDVTIATTNADGSMRSLTAILADCRSAFGQLSDSKKARPSRKLSFAGNAVKCSGAFTGTIMAANPLFGAASAGWNPPARNAMPELSMRQYWKMWWFR